MKKTNQKCIRFTDETLEYIGTFPGKGFSQKLESMVDYVHKNEHRIKMHIADLEKHRDFLEQKIIEYSHVGEKLKVIGDFVNRAYQNTLFK